jgi:calcineurin-like phosphoesterase family protein
MRLAYTPATAARGSAGASSRLGRSPCYDVPVQRLVKKSATLPIDGDSVRLAVVSDTHSQPHGKTAERLAALAPAAILHGGDIGDLRVLDDLGKVAPVYAVRGNIDTHARNLPDVLTLDVGALRILLIHIAVCRADHAVRNPRVKSHTH